MDAQDAGEELLGSEGASSTFPEKQEASVTVKLGTLVLSKDLVNNTCVVGCQLLSATLFALAMLRQTYHIP